MALPEVLLTAVGGDGTCGVRAWALPSALPLMAYRGGSTAPRSMCVLRGEYVLAAQAGKQYINVWETQRKDQLQQKVICPGVVTCLVASPDGLHIVVGIAESLYVWETSSGGLLDVLCRHYQDIMCLSFADDGGHFVSGGKDNLAIVWSLAGILRNGEPRHVWNQHTLPVMDVCCGVGGVRARVATASLDQTAKLWELGSGLLLFSVVLGMPVTAVALDPAEYWLFCGTSPGTISVVPLHTTKREQMVQINAEEKNCLRGHKAEVTCMAVTMDGGMLVSGSADGTVCLWDIDSGQCIRTIPHKGPVNALLLVSRLRGVLSNAEARPSLPLPRFSRLPRTAEAGGGTDFFIAPEEQPPPGYLDHVKSWTTVIHDAIHKGDGISEEVQRENMTAELTRLRRINSDLYHFSANELKKLL
uniref:WD repeat-containing protein 18 isoform X2 n=1 Tax=Myxine glutinosa TaxID=7769 RepID=UPI00358F0AF8